MNFSVYETSMQAQQQKIEKEEKRKLNLQDRLLICIALLNQKNETKSFKNDSIL